MGRDHESGVNNDFGKIPPMTQFIIFAAVLLTLSAIPTTSGFALTAALIVLALQLLAMSKKGHAL